ncbi:glycerol-3-phosphate acyltransferase [Pseudothermotoga sp. U03pept]|uniref:glycerol-3-phosphate acyltransferase n=1 Tax=Pseudothermotoga sp. U03pept TaxID=3447012 RepID=UPI003F0423AC
MTGTYDVLKGILAVSMSSSFGYHETISHLSGLCAVAGHVFPFYLGFRGGNGAATSVGLLLFMLWKIATMVQLSTLLSDFLILLSIVLVFYFCTKKGDIIGLFVLPALALLIAIRINFSQSWFTDTLIGILS